MIPLIYTGFLIYPFFFYGQNRIADHNILTIKKQRKNKPSTNVNRVLNLASPPKATVVLLSRQVYSLRPSYTKNAPYFLFEIVVLTAKFLHIYELHSDDTDILHWSANTAYTHKYPYHYVHYTK